jgi:hypothetical protein
MKETVFGNADGVEDFVCNLWSEVTLDEMHPVLQEWMRPLEWLCEQVGEYCTE